MPNVLPSTTSPRATHAPSILGIWRLGEPIQQGEMACLNLAQPADSGGSPRWDYVIKWAATSQHHCDGRGQEFQAQQARTQVVQFAAAAASVTHPNLVAVLDGSVSGPSPFVVMPRLEGETMQSHFDSIDAKPLPVALWLIRQAAQALSAMHDVGWVHGDVKPENIMVGPRGHVTVIDLGFALRVHTPIGPVFRGTPAYASPELASGNTAALTAMDIFSLGRVLWQWLARVEPASESQLEPVAELVEHMVAEQPNERPEANEVAQRLLQLEIETLGRHIGPGTGIRRAA